MNDSYEFIRLHACGKCDLHNHCHIYLHNVQNPPRKVRSTWRVLTLLLHNNILSLRLVFFSIKTIEYYGWLMNPSD